MSRGLNLKLNGHYAYYGITGNSRSLRELHHQVRRLWRKWLSRRNRDGQRGEWSVSRRALARGRRPGRKRKARAADASRLTTRDDDLELCRAVTDRAKKMFEWRAPSDPQDPRHEHPGGEAAQGH